MSNIFYLGIDVDPGVTLGTSVQRDLAYTAEFLHTKVGVPQSNLTICFTDGAPVPAKTPRSTHLARSVEWAAEYRALRARCPPGGTILVHVSGHGMQSRDVSGDETDGMDEFVRVAPRVMVFDDDFYRTIVQPEVDTDPSRRVKLRLISDTCHSGTMFDLPYQLNYEGTAWRAAKRSISEKAKEVDVFSIGACKDTQLALCGVGDYSGFGGVLTISLLDTKAMGEYVTGDPVQAFAKVREDLRYKRQIPILQNTSISEIPGQPSVEDVPTKSETGEAPPRTRKRWATKRRRKYRGDEPSIVLPKRAEPPAAAKAWGKRHKRRARKV